jgi:hypothetical protein
MKEVPEEVQRHIDLIPIQRGMYAIQKREIAEGRKPDTILITQDFTQLELDSSFVQDLIICCYQYDPNSKDGLKRTYRHFVGEINESNEIPFVAGSWLQILKEDWFENIETVQIWSDGGPKHFKISSNMKLLKAIQDQHGDIGWIYNFFPAYHGYSVCDAAAAHAKRAINENIRNENRAIRTPEEAVKVINTWENHIATKVSSVDMDFSTITLRGIRSYYKFETFPNDSHVYGFDDSTDLNYSKKWKLNSFFNLKKLEKYQQV